VADDQVVVERHLARLRDRLLRRRRGRVHHPAWQLRTVFRGFLCRKWRQQKIETKLRSGTYKSRPILASLRKA
jgi:hypothetical protein